MKKRILITVLVICFAVFLAVLPSLSKGAINAFLLKETATDVADRPVRSEPVMLCKGDYVVFGEYLGEPVLWQVLDTQNGKALLMTKYIICLKAFDAGGECARHDGEDRAEYGSSKWEESTLQTWLNSAEQTVTYTDCRPDIVSLAGGYNAYDGESGFLSDKNFSEKQREMINERGVFLLSKSELSKYMTAAQRRKTCTASAVRDNDAPYLLTTSQRTWYWTSSAVSSNRVSAATVTSAGGYYKSLAYDGVTGVAPALYLRGTEILTNGGDGSEKSPYFINR